MFLTGSRSRKLVLVVCAFVSLAILWSYHLPRLGSYRQRAQTDLVRSQVVNNVDLSSADAPFVSWPLARLCSETTRWTSGLVFLCDNNSGGIGNIRNFVLTCLRYAIEAGATGLTMPTIQTRSEDRLSELFKGKKLPFSYFFDEGHFRDSLRDACPQITIYDTVGDIRGFERDDEKQQAGGPTIQPWDTITPNSFGMRGGCDPRDLNRHVDLFGQRFHAWLRERQEQLGLPPVTADAPKLIRFSWGVQWTFPVYRDGPEFVATFGGLLRFHASILEIGMATADAMDRLAREAGADTGFLGMHLRTESDALGGWPSFEEQSSAYLGRAAQLHPRPRMAYLATGNKTEAERLASVALDGAALTVVTKHGVLAGPEHAELKRRLDGWSWDQQALVDFVVLLRAEYFVGVSPSSFSMNVALKRHLQGEGLYTRPWRAGAEEGDGRSWLVGRYDGYWDDWLFMYESLWP